MERIYSVNMVGQFDERPSYSDRVALFTSIGSVPNSFIVAPKQESVHETMMKRGLKLRHCQSRNDTDRCISRDEFPSRVETQRVMEKSNYTLALRGDSYGSDRWFQAMVAGTALIQGRARGLVKKLCSLYLYLKNSPWVFMTIKNS